MQGVLGGIEVASRQRRPHILHGSLEGSSHGFLVYPTSCSPSSCVMWDDPSDPSVIIHVDGAC